MLAVAEFFAFTGFAPNDASGVVSFTSTVMFVSNEPFSWFVVFTVMLCFPGIVAVALNQKTIRSLPFTTYPSVPFVQLRTLLMFTKEVL